uniref:Uncharacterized protein n=1 Tax=Geospiza parvula TaxID=87175 RepID=A0A8U8CAU2_GEOPR
MNFPLETHTSTAARGAQRDARTAPRPAGKRLDTAQMATTSHTLVAALAAAGPSSTPAADAASLGSSSDTLSVAVAERAGSPWSRTTISSLWRGPSASSSSPTRNGPLPRGSHSSYSS